MIGQQGAGAAEAAHPTSRRGPKAGRVQLYIPHADLATWGSARTYAWEHRVSLGALTTAALAQYLDQAAEAEEAE